MAGLVALVVFTAEQPRFAAGFCAGAAAALGVRLREVIARTGLGVSGPNCMGNVCKPASFVTLTEDRPHNMDMGEKQP